MIFNSLWCIFLFFRFLDDGAFHLQAYDTARGVPFMIENKLIHFDFIIRGEFWVLGWKAQLYSLALSLSLSLSLTCILPINDNIVYCPPSMGIDIVYLFCISGDVPDLVLGLDFFTQLEVFNLTSYFQFSDSYPGFDVNGWYLGGRADARHNFCFAILRRAHTRTLL
jgi:hypothetical protein